MPAGTDILLLLRLLAYLGDKRMRIDRVKKSIHVYLAPAARELDVLIRGYILISQENNTIVDESLTNLGKLFITDPGGDIDMGFVTDGGICWPTRCRVERIWFVPCAP